MIMTGKTQAQVDAEKALVAAKEQIVTAEAYLRGTDWKIARSVETATTVDAATLTKRASARAEIMALRGKFSL